jgi:hypothetical protein
MTSDPGGALGIGVQTRWWATPELVDMAAPLRRHGVSLWRRNRNRW